MITYNQEVKAIIEENGGKVIYSSGNIIVATDITTELARQLALQREYIETFTQLPLKPFKENYDTIILDDDISSETVVNQEGGGTVGGGV